MTFDIEEIKALRSLVDVVGDRVELKKNGKEFTGLCPFHSEKTPSFTVNTERYHCYGCGEHGDVIDFIMETEAVTFAQACEILGGKRKPSKDIATRAKVKKVITSCYDGIEPITPVPNHAILMTPNKKTPPIWNPKRDEGDTWRESTYKPEMVFEYTTPEGQLIGYVLRVVIDGNKLTPQVMWCKRGDKEGWCHFSFPEPRPLYGLAGLYRNPDAPVMIVEGEKCVDSAHRLLPTYNVVTWTGGTNGYRKTDWTPLKGKKITMWPDADEVGAKTMTDIAKLLTEQAESIKIIHYDDAKPKGWDVADAEADKWDKDKIITWAKDRIAPYPPLEAIEPPLDALDDPPEDEIVPLDAYTKEMDEVVPIAVEEVVPDVPFKALGYRNNVFYYMPNKTQQLMKLSPQAHVKNNLMLLAPLSYWESHHVSKKGVDWDGAYEALMNLQSRAGIFDEQNGIRGRGAWIDKGRSILHLGSHVYVDGVSYSPSDVVSKYAYPKDIDLDIDASHPATTKEAKELLKICKDLNWKHPLSGTILAGWLVIAPVCGMLKWRPHLWITGKPGSGKSTILECIVSKVLGKMGQILANSTTEAAIRQKLDQDALPIVIDEFESTDPKISAMVQSVLGLARTSSSGGVISKGSADGVGKTYRVRSCFLFGSINATLYHKADEDRISKLILQSDDSAGADDRWQAKLSHILQTCTTSYADKMLSRTLKHLKVLQANCDTFTNAATVIVKNRRIADQVGTLLAGAYLCYSTEEISKYDAEAWVKKQDWTEHTTIDAKGDEERLFDRLFTNRIRFNSSAGLRETSLGELIVVASGRFDSDDDITATDAKRELRLYGITVSDSDVGCVPTSYAYISNNSNPIEKLLVDTPWVKDWGRALKDLKGAEGTKSMYFSVGIQSRATRLPVSLFLERRE